MMARTATGMGAVAISASLAEREPHLDAITRGWQMGKAARSLFGDRWNELWTRPIGDVRAALGVDPVIDAARPELAAAA